MLTKWLGLHSSLLVWLQVWTHPLKPCFVPAALAVNILLVNYKLRTCSSAVSNLTTLEKLSWRPNTVFKLFSFEPTHGVGILSNSQILSS